MINYFFQGLATGLFIAFPAGPIGILCLRRLLTQGPLIGFVSGLGGACADVIFAFISAFGLGFIADFVINHSFFVKLSSGIFLIILGITIFFLKPRPPHKQKSLDVLGSFFSTVFLTLSNPLLIITFIAYFAAFGVNYIDMNSLEMSLLLIGVFLGSTWWWLFFAGITILFKPKISLNAFIIINKISGIGIGIFGLLLLGNLFSTS